MRGAYHRNSFPLRLEEQRTDSDGPEEQQIDDEPAKLSWYPRIHTKRGTGNIAFMQGYKGTEVTWWLQLVYHFLIENGADQDSLREYEELRHLIEDDFREVNPSEVYYCNIARHDGTLSPLSRRQIYERISRVSRMLGRFGFESDEATNGATRGRPKEAKYEEGHIIWSGKRLNIQKNSLRARLCAKMFMLPTKVCDGYPWREVYEHVYADPPPSENAWRQIDSLVRTLNASAKKKGIPLLLKFGGGEVGTVERLR